MVILARCTASSFIKAYHFVFAKRTSMSKHIKVRVFVDFGLDVGQLNERCQDHGIAEYLQQGVAVFQSSG